MFHLQTPCCTVSGKLQNKILVCQLEKAELVQYDSETAMDSPLMTSTPSWTLNQTDPPPSSVVSAASTSSVVLHAASSFTVALISGEDHEEEYLRRMFGRGGWR
jgi:hypothetical protein